LGFAYATGEGVRQDNRTAVEWFRKAADQGDAKAQYNLGFAYANGQGVRQNKSMAKEFFGKACDGGMQDGCDSYKKLNE
ncbi:tetratricopeptide repeat protein, partial [Klebsiella pneumoniae]|uniref:tetratricopeptide repeat protein n=1 Tax=Klebsiella pneumoniae TaxID=573 RepID=UPI003CCFFB2D